MSNILIAGCGYIGTTLALRLTAAGHNVWGMRRGTRTLPEPIATLTYDLKQPITIDEDLTFDYVVCTIGANAHTEAAYRTAYVDCVRNLVEALYAQTQPPKRIVFTSSTAVYAQDDGAWVDETSPTEPTHFSGRRVLEGERIVRDTGIGVVLRLGGIYGPSRTRLIESVRDGTAALDEGPPRYMNLNHRDDTARALEHLLFMDNPEQVYLGADGHPEERNAILCWIAKQLGQPEPPPASRIHNSARQATNKRCTNARLLQTGFTFTYPNYQSGYQPLLDA